MCVFLFVKVENNRKEISLQAGWESWSGFGKYGGGRGDKGQEVALREQAIAAVKNFPRNSVGFDEKVHDERTRPREGGREREWGRIRETEQAREIERQRGEKGMVAEFLTNNR